MTHDLLPPLCGETEDYLLAAMLGNPSVIDMAADRLMPQDFFSQGHQRLFTEMTVLRATGKAVDVATLSAALPDDRETIIALSGAPYISSYASDYCRIIKQTSLRRQAMHVGQRIRELAADNDDVEEVLDSAEQMVLDLRTTRETTDGAPVRELISDCVDRAKRALEGKPTFKMRTHWKTVNDMIGGLEAGQFITLAAYTGQGKTSFALNLAQHMAADNNVAYFSLEMGRDELMDRIVACMARVPVLKMKAGAISPDEYADWVTAAGEMERLKLHIDDSAALSVLDLQRKARRIKARFGLDLLIVDYIQLMTSSVKESRQQEVANITRNLKILAKELEVPVIGLSQFNRQQKSIDQEGNLRKRKPDLSDLRESGAIEQDSDMVWFLWRKDDYSDPLFIVAKNRSGSTGEQALDFFPQFTEFRDKR